MPTKTVLFVCYGNICRSPMAEGFLRKILSESNTKMQVLSAGLNTYGWPPTDKAVAIMKGEKIAEGH